MDADVDWKLREYVDAIYMLGPFDSHFIVAKARFQDETREEFILVLSLTAARKRKEWKVSTACLGHIPLVSRQLYSINVDFFLICILFLMLCCCLYKAQAVVEFMAPSCFIFWLAPSDFSSCNIPRQKERANAELPIISEKESQEEAVFVFTYDSYTENGLDF